MRISINAGHGGADPGAVGNGHKEADVARLIKDGLIAQARARGALASDGTASDGSTNAQAASANAFAAGLALSIHLNAGGGTGCEAYYAAGTAQANIALAKKISAALAGHYGFPDRGAKPDVTPRLPKGMNFLRRTNMPALLIEWCFIDSAADMAKVLADVPGGARAVLDQVLGAPAQDTQPVPVPEARDGWTPGRHYVSGGKDLTGWHELSGRWYLFDVDGTMLTGWQMDGGSWYMLSDRGMVTGWLRDWDNSWYWLNPEKGDMATGNAPVEGKTHRFSDKGVWLMEVPS
jgi:hypothetical protein